MVYERAEWFVYKTITEGAGSKGNDDQDTSMCRSVEYMLVLFTSRPAHGNAIVTRYTRDTPGDLVRLSSGWSEVYV